MTSTFSGGAPGLKLELLLERLTLADIKAILGEPLVAMVGREKGKTELVGAAAHVLRSEPARLNDPALFNLLLRNLPKEKLSEFPQRAKGNGIAALSAEDRASQELLIGFLGVASRDETRTRIVPSMASVAPTYGLFSHQRSVVRRTSAALAGGTGRAVIHMPTGSGKTRTSMHYAAEVLSENDPSVIVWLASGRELLDQASEAFEIAWSHLGNREIGLARFWSNHDPDLGKFEDGMVVGGFQKFHAWKRKNPLDAMRLASKTRLVIVDEAHQAIANTYRAIIEGLAEAGQHNAVLGLTATPGRSWSDISADEELAAFFNDKKIVLEIPGHDNPVDYLLEEGYLARPQFRRLDYSHESDAFSHSSTATIGGYESDYGSDELDALAVIEARNRAILDGLQELIAEGHQRIIFFGASVEHARLISTLLELEGISAPIVTGETPEAKRREAIRLYKSNSQKPIVMCNFGVLTTGFDAPATSAAIIARPTRSLVLFSQMVGRATRGPKAGGNKESTVLTVHDPSCPGFGDVAEAFFNWEDVWSE